jgi:hypothetical protein
MRHPFETIAANKRKLWFEILFPLTLGVMVIMQATGHSLQTDAAPQGIVSFELAGDSSTAQAIIQSWTPAALPHAGFSLGFDFVFMPLYSTTIGLACVWAAGVLTLRLAAVGTWLAWGQWLAALLDAVENGALLVMLLEAARAPWPQIALWCAALKFGLVFLGLGYAALGAVGWMVQRLR